MEGDIIHGWFRCLLQLPPSHDGLTELTRYLLPPVLSLCSMDPDLPAPGVWLVREQRKKNRQRKYRGLMRRKFHEWPCDGLQLVREEVADLGRHGDKRWSERWQNMQGWRSLVAAFCADTHDED